MADWQHWKLTVLRNISAHTRRRWIKSGKIPPNAVRKEMKYDPQYRCSTWSLEVDIDIVTQELIENIKNMNNGGRGQKGRPLPTMSKAEIEKVIILVGEDHAAPYYRMLADPCRY